MQYNKKYNIQTSPSLTGHIWAPEWGNVRDVKGKYLTVSHAATNYTQSELREM